MLLSVKRLPHWEILYSTPGVHNCDFSCREAFNQGHFLKNASQIDSHVVSLAYITLYRYRYSHPTSKAVLSTASIIIFMIYMIFMLLNVYKQFNHAQKQVQWNAAVTDEILIVLFDYLERRSELFFLPTYADSCSGIYLPQKSQYWAVASHRLWSF